jgi:hypothetical protein
MPTGKESARAKTQGGHRSHRDLRWIATGVVWHEVASRETNFQHSSNDRGRTWSGPAMIYRMLCQGFHFTVLESEPGQSFDVVNSSISFARHFCCC